MIHLYRNIRYDIDDIINQQGNKIFNGWCCK